MMKTLSKIVGALLIGGVAVALCGGFAAPSVPGKTAKVKTGLRTVLVTSETVVVGPHKLARIDAVGIDPKAALIWKVFPSKEVDKATSPRGRLEFIAPPGEYEVSCFVITQLPDGSLDAEELSITVIFEPCCHKPPPPQPPVPPKPDPKPPEPNKPKPDAANALGRIQFGNAGCTATVVYPRRADGKWDVLTAAHCVERVGVGAKGTMKMKDGRTIGVRVVSIHDYPHPDLAWLVTEDANLDLPYAMIAEKNPEVGTEIWHMGYGVDKPGNREEGTVIGGENHDGQLSMNLSVSSGDSGGGIFRKDTNELIAVVCCTTRLGGKTTMWGGSAEQARKTRPKSASEWEPMEMPTRGPRVIEEREVDRCECCPKGVCTCYPPSNIDKGCKCSPCKCD